MKKRPTNWVFLGDSLTEGIGSRRISYVTELTKLFQEAEQHRPEADRRTIHEFRLKQVNPDTFNRFAQFNVAGYWNNVADGNENSLWLWNLAAEARTIETDQEWLPFIENLQPELFIIYRGSLESIIRPAMVSEGIWPSWVPRSWRYYAAMDPRCYFSTTWWRRAKQMTIDRLKQVVRHHLLQQKPGNPLMDAETLINHYRHLIESLRGTSSRILILGLMPPDNAKFPGSSEHFCKVNELLRKFAMAEGADFFDWSPINAAKSKSEMLYRDGFHPNQAGARILAETLQEHLSTLAVKLSKGISH